MALAWVNQKVIEGKLYTVWRDTVDPKKESITIHELDGNGRKKKEIITKPDIKSGIKKEIKEIKKETDLKGIKIKHLWKNIEELKKYGN